MLVRNAWIRRRWMDFRYGHSVYLVFLMGFSNFILLAYNFAPTIKTSIGIMEFSILFLLLYIPSAVLIGHWHIKHQLPAETAIGTEQTPYREQILRGKEELYNKYSIFSAQFQQWSTRLTKKNMVALNYLLEHFDAPSEIRYKEEIAMVEKWLEVQKKWEEIFELYNKGRPATEIMKEKLNPGPRDD